MKKANWRLVFLLCILLLLPAFALSEGPTGLFTALRADGSGFIYAKEDGQISKLSCTSCPDGAGGLFIRASFSSAEIGQLYHFTNERQLVLLQENDACYGSAGEQYVWDIFLWNDQLAGIDPYNKAVKTYDGQSWRKAVDIDLSCLPSAQQDNNFFINGMAARAIGDKLYFTAFSYCDTVLELNLKTGLICPLATQKRLQPAIMVDEDGFYYADRSQNVYFWDVAAQTETFCFASPTEKVSAFQDGHFLGYTQAEASVWAAGAPESTGFSTRLPASEANLSLIWLRLLDSQTILFENAWLFEILPMQEAYIKEQVYEVYVEHDRPQIEAYLEEALDNPAIGYAMLRAFDNEPLYRPKLIYERGNPHAVTQGAFFSGLDLYSSNDAPHNVLTLKQVDENLRALCGAAGLASDWEWSVSDYDDIDGCYTYQTNIGDAVIQIEMLEKDENQEIARFAVNQRLTYEEGSEGFELVFVCCYLGMRGELDDEEWLQIEPYFEGQIMVYPALAKGLMDSEDSFTYVLLDRNDSFEYEVYAAGATIEAVFAPLY